MRINTIEVGTFMDTRTTQNHESEPADVKAVLEELFVLLEDYSPAWYTEEQRTRTMNALFCAQRLAS